LETLALTVPGPNGRRIAVLGDMRELGDHADAVHGALAEPIEAAQVDLVFSCGPHMGRLARALPRERCGAHGADSSELMPEVTAAVRAGDVVMVKGSLGSRMAPIVEALLALGRDRDTTADQPFSKVR
jgi:UDP-N-acetylmuramoyl-tripeptide--D-alanyl-D-alanine ligase